MNGSKISFHDFTKIISYDVVKNNSCIEIEFYIDNDSNYESCWLGKTIDKETNNECYWYGLVKDGSQAYSFLTIDEFMNAKIFYGKNIREVWDFISLYCIDCCDVNERLSHYLDIN